MFIKEPDPIAPVYRYFTVDLLSNRVLAEIPFGGVAYERAVKSAGAFAGRIPVIEKTNHLDLYENTLPGKTALFVVRNGICVWGGIIWSRNYDVLSRVLNISASEFTSYLYHRRIWKTFNNQYEAVVSVAAGAGAVQISYGSTEALKAGASVFIEFYEPENFRYNDYYTVASTPSPTTEAFALQSIAKTATVLAASRNNTTVTVTTSGPHGFQLGDSITLSGLGTGFNGTYAITSVLGANSDQFTYTDSVNTLPLAATVDSASLAARPIPEGVYGMVTLTVRTDTYDYIRSLIDGVFKDFVGIDFPNDYIEPGISYGNLITNRKLEFGRATITTAEPHGLALGQAVQIQDLAPVLDGEYTVVEVPAANQFQYETGGALAAAPAVVSQTTVTGVSLANSVVTAYGSCPLLYVGRTVEMDCGENLPGATDLFTGSFRVTAVASDFSWFQYAVLSTETIPYTPFNSPTATFSGNVRTIVGRKLVGNVATVTTAEAHGFSVGNNAVVANVAPRYAITEKSLDAGSSTARITTSTPHYLSAGDSVVITGLRDSSNIKRVRSTTNAVTFTTDTAHNFAVGDAVTIDQIKDRYTVTNKALTSNVATLTLATSTNLPAQIGTTINISDIYDTAAITSRSLTDGVATVTTAGNHNYHVNDVVTINNLVDVASITSKSIEENVVTLSTASAHNFFETDEITVTGVGAPYDGVFKVVNFTDTQVQYELDSDVVGDIVYSAPTSASGTISSNNSIFNGEATVESVTSTSFSFSRAGNDVAVTATPGGQSPTVEGWSAFNGSFTITAASTTTVSYALVGNNVASTPVPAPPEPQNGAAALPAASAWTYSIWSGLSGPVQSMTRNTITLATTSVAIGDKDAEGVISANSIFNGTRTVVSVTKNVFTFALSATNNVLETTTTNKAYVTAPNLFGTGGVITAITPNSFSYARVHATDVPFGTVPGYGKAVSSPLAIVSTFGPYPGNADIGMEFSTQRYSGANILPKIYRGFELTNVGEALDQYSDNLDGFEYRIDCSFDEENNLFRKTFVLIPINFPDPPSPGEVSPTSRYGADKLVFEYPGNIINVRITESAENAATRFFAVGETDLGPDAGPPFSVAAAEDLLNGKTISGDPNYREWPLLDDDEKIDNVDDEAALYGFAARYLDESRPPVAQLSVDVNGSLQPIVGSYGPGDWCSLVIDDHFVQMRLQTDLEPRDDVIVRKIDSMKVSVPDGTTTPETVSLTLVAEWEVDKRGE